MSKIFLSYRRADSRDVVERLYERLSESFGKGTVFKDVDSIPAGVDFRETLHNALGKSSALVVIIGQGWLQAKNASGVRRLLLANDYVRMELKEAFQRKIKVIPVLIHDAALPKTADLPEDLHPLAYQQALRIRPDPDFSSDVARLIRTLSSSGIRRRVRWTVPVTIAATTLILAVLGVIGASSLRGKSEHQERQQEVKSVSVQQRAERLAQMIKDHVSPTGWDQPATGHTISTLESLLTISTTDDDHRAIQAFLTQLRKQRGLEATPQSDDAPESAMIRRLRRALDETTEVSFIDNSLTDSLMYLSELHGIPFLLDIKSLERNGISSESQVTLDLTGVPLKFVLNEMLKDLQLNYIVGETGILVTTQKVYRATTTVRIYNVKDLLQVE